MATLVLTAVGTALGGPIGGALGSMVGQAIDTQLFGPGPRRGPRLDDLKVQTSSYGTQIPRIYGRMRVAGTVVWATDLKETEEVEGGGKGSPETIHYNYSCSLAVALSSRPIAGIGRIWADGKLIRGKNGDLKVKTRLRVLSGAEDQAVDPVMAEVEGHSKSPAYRGLALAVFEDLELAEFGNRIPMLTFEVIGDTAPVGIHSIVADVCGPALAAPAGPGDMLVGFAAMGSDRRAAVETFAELADVRFVESGEGLAIRSAGENVRALDADEAAGWSEGRRKAPAQGEWKREPASGLPARLTVRYHEPSRDFQAGLMAASTAGGRGEASFDSAAAMDAGTAKAWAERALARRWAGRDCLSLNLSADWADLRPADEIELPWRAGRWIVEEVGIEAFVVRASCRRTAHAGTALGAEPGRAVDQPDAPIGRSVIALVDLPSLGGASDGALRLHAAVSCDGAFKPVVLSASAAGTTAAPATAWRKARIGLAEDSLDAAPAGLVDTASRLVVQLTDPSQILLNANDDALDAGANLASVGPELVQFGRAQELGGGRYRLSRFLRGRGGTEWAVGGHGAGEPFVMVDPAALVPMTFDPSLLGITAWVEAHGVADDPADPPAASAPLGGASLAPLSPCHIRFGAEGRSRVSWCRRSLSRMGWDQGSDEAIPSAAFDVLLEGPSGTIRRRVANPYLDVTDEDRDVIGPGSVVATITEQGAWRSSPPASAALAF